MTWNYFSNLASLYRKIFSHLNFLKDLKANAMPKGEFKVSKTKNPKLKEIQLFLGINVYKLKTEN